MAVAVLAVGAFIAGSRHDIRSHDLPAEDVRSQAAYVYAHRTPDDVVLVNLNSNWGFAYYWPAGTPAQSASTTVMQKYIAVFPDQPRLVIARNRDASGVQAALDQALSLVRSHSGARVWVVRTHVTAVEAAAWSAALQADHLTLRQVNSAGLSVIVPGS